VARAFTLHKGEVAREPFALPSGYAFIALDEIQASRLPELKEAQEKVRADLVEEKALARARELAAQVRARAEKDGLDKAAAALGLVRKETPGPVGRGPPSSAPRAPWRRWPTRFRRRRSPSRSGPRAATRSCA